MGLYDSLDQIKTVCVAFSDQNILNYLMSENQ